MKRHEAFPSKYLGKDDVVHPLVLTIASVVMEQIKGDEGVQEDKAVIYFADRDSKPFILNNTNWLSIESAYGEESDGWKGKRIELFIDPNVTFGKKKIGGVRVRIPSGGSDEESFGDGPPVWTLAQACDQAALVGITREQLIAHFKAAGQKSWVPDRDTPLVQKMIADKVAANQQRPAGPATEEEQTPF